MDFFKLWILAMHDFWGNLLLPWRSPHCSQGGVKADVVVLGKLVIKNVVYEYLDVMKIPSETDINKSCIN